MKIGIITVHRSQNNYGAALQAYALWKYICSLGFDCEIIDLYRPIHIGFQASRVHLPLRKKEKRTIKSFFKNIKGLFTKSKKQKTKRILTPEAVHRFEEFNSQIKYSQPYYSVDSLYENPPEYDVYITGSDQVWNPAMPYSIEPYFLTFVNNGGRKISYASSVGLSSLLPEEKRKYSIWLSSYDFISVRELTGANLLKQIVKKNIQQVCDPTILLSKEQWERQKKTITIKKKYILLFSLFYDKEAIDSCLNLAEESGYELVYLSVKHPLGDNSKYIVVTDAGPGEWLSYLQNAELVITNSFHGTILSIILHTKNFYSYVMKGSKNGSRIVDLLDIFGMDSHLIDKFPLPSFKELMENSIDYQMVENILERERNRSIDYLKEALIH